ncbi:MAG: hypothetical protein KBD24_00160 [Candidatus Pacebacteria bacterium]|nr:hypothetical protein [Candidatus Paceibacterota bacterium]
MTEKLTFKPKAIVKRLLNVLPERAQHVLTSRYGLGENTNPVTLEAIGQEYGITRERVRQIENYALATIRKSEVYAKEQSAFIELHSIIQKMGSVVSEDELLEALAKDVSTRNHIHLMLVLGDAFMKEKESEEFHHRWYIDQDVADRVHGSLRRLYDALGDDELVEESTLIDAFLRELQDVNKELKDQEILKRWLNLSKSIGKNPLGEWGRAHSPNVRAKGMRDYAYLVIKRHGSPMHFREVASTISELFKRKAHEATCHNELIKDERFVLVGRGIYALKEWGYNAGPVREVIAEILRKDGPLTREEVIDAVRKERYVKDNTIFINLQDPSRFGRDAESRYFIRQEKK